MRVPIRVKRLREDAAGIVKSEDADLGWDIHCVADDDFRYHLMSLPAKDEKKHFILGPGHQKIFKTGLAIAIPPEYGFLYRDRSGMGAKRRITVTAGVIDSSYRGEYMVALENLGTEPQIIYEGDRIVQAILVHNIPAEVEYVNDLDATIRGSRGFGSSGA